MEEKVLGMAVNLGEINSVKCHLKIDVVLYPTRAERLGKDLQEAPYSHWIVQGNRSEISASTLFPQKL